MFHCLAANCADLLIGDSKSQRSDTAWRQVYRALDHNEARTACARPETSAFPESIQEFARQFVAMQEMRHKADYSAEGAYYRSDVAILIDEAEKVIEGFAKSPELDRRAFAAWVLFKMRKA
jgi:hypothetical protein